MSNNIKHVVDNERVEPKIVVWTLQEDEGDIMLVANNMPVAYVSACDNTFRIFIDLSYGCAYEEVELPILNKLLEE